MKFQKMPKLMIFFTFTFFFNQIIIFKGWGAIAKLKQNQEVLVRIGYNLGQLFRDSPWSYNPLYTQIGLVNKSTHRINIDAMPETSSAKQREGLAWFGCNLGQIFRDTSWTFDPVYTQNRQMGNLEQADEWEDKQDKMLKQKVAPVLFSLLCWFCLRHGVSGVDSKCWLLTCLFWV